MAFTTKQLIFIALMAALLFVVNFTIGAGIIAVTEIPASSGFITGLTNVLVVTFVALTMRKFGALSLLYLVYGILALPTFMAGGPPGFVWKIPMLVLSAFIFESGLWFFRYKKYGFIISLPIFVVTGLLIYLGGFWLFGIPGLDKFIQAIPVFLVLFIMLGYLGMWLGFKLFNKFKNKRILQQITS